MGETTLPQVARRQNGVQRPASFYLQAAAAGSLAACLTHLVMVPLDVLKTRMQLDRQAYPNLRAALRGVWTQEGWRGVTLGMGPTNWGYLTQGAFKYGLYELLKGVLPGLLGQAAAERAAFCLYLGAGMAAEATADVFLTPFEAVRIRLVADPRYARSTFGAMHRMITTEGLRGLYRGFGPLLGRQVPYTAVKLATFELMEELFYDYWLRDTPRERLTSGQQLAITATSGFVGGVASAIVSHPADTLLTRINTGNFVRVGEALRSASIWVGLTPRMGMIGTLAALQLLTYDAVKVMFFGLPTSQGIKHKADNEPTRIK